MVIFVSEQSTLKALIQDIKVEKINAVCTVHKYPSKGKVQKKRGKKLTSVSFMYVCVAGNGEMLVFFSFFPPTIV